ncbi:aspartyl protease [Talaromyces pinophilus]|uniref:Aspartyl protease n=1 Tax=Talaromyces pinophilus TaxID=128442 RepID=A0A6V8HIX9_TALPI|nr:aspartyl protease [Talaromyces pinophilus]
MSSPFRVQESDEPLFLCDISLGTPPQDILAFLDTRRSYLAVSAWNSSSCAEGTSTTYEREQCALGAPFDVSNSSTYTSTGGQVNTTIGESGKLFPGILGTDMLTIGSTTLDTNFIVDYNEIADNILGLGYSLNESYTSLPQALVKSGQINSAAYSLWADDLRDNGTILFGGVNSAKYTGELHTMSIPSADLPAVLVTDVYVQRNSSTPVNTNASGVPAYMILDSFAFFTYVPDAVVEQIYLDLNVTFGQNGVSVGEVADCSSVKSQNYSIIFTFADFDINVPLSFFIYEDSGSCEFTIVPSGGEAGFLGADFLRAVYTVFDLSNNEISLAQRNFNNSVPDRILEIGNGSTAAAIPGAVSVSAVTATIALPQTTTEPPMSQTLIFPPTSSIPASSTSTAAAKNAAPTLDSIRNNLAAGLIGAGVWFAL